MPNFGTLTLNQYSNSPDQVVYIQDGHTITMKNMVTCRRSAPSKKAQQAGSGKMRTNCLAVRTFPSQVSGNPARDVTVSIAVAIPIDVDISSVETFITDFLKAAPDAIAHMAVTGDINVTS